MDSSKWRELLCVPQLNEINSAFLSE